MREGPYLLYYCSGHKSNGNFKAYWCKLVNDYCYRALICFQSDLRANFLVEGSKNMM